MTVLWLDDYRDPLKEGWLVTAPVPLSLISDVIWVKTYNEFVDYISINGLPDAVCLDHDLAEAHYSHIPQTAEEHAVTIDSFEEKTGYHAAMWLTDYCTKNGLKLPSYSSHSANPIGRIRILMHLSDHEKHA